MGSSLHYASSKLAFIFQEFIACVRMKIGAFLIIKEKLNVLMYKCVCMQLTTKSIYLVNIYKLTDPFSADVAKSYNNFSKLFMNQLVNKSG